MLLKIWSPDKLINPDSNLSVKNNDIETSNSYTMKKIKTTNSNIFYYLFWSIFKKSKPDKGKLVEQKNDLNRKMIFENFEQ